MTAFGGKGLTFDVFGTVVDWRTGIARKGRRLGARPRRPGSGGAR